MTSQDRSAQRTVQRDLRQRNTETRRDISRQKRKIYTRGFYMLHVTIAYYIHTYISAKNLPTQMHKSL